MTLADFGLSRETIKRFTVAVREENLNADGKPRKRNWWPGHRLFAPEVAEARRHESRLRSQQKRRGMNNMNGKRG